MTKIALELEFFQPKHPSNQGVHIKSVDNDEQQKQYREDVEECLTKHWDDISFTHNFREGWAGMIDYLEEVIAQGCRYSGCISLIGDWSTWRRRAEMMNLSVCSSIARNNWQILTWTKHNTHKRQCKPWPPWATNPAIWHSQCWECD